MKVLLYTEGIKHISKSGLGKALKHQMKALEENDVEYTLNKKDEYNVVHINFYGPNSYRLAKKAKKQGKKVVYHAHSTEEDFRNSFIGSNLVSPLFKKWIIKCYNTADHIITPTPYSKKILKGYGIKKPVTAISNGIDMDFYEKNDTYADTFRKAYEYRKTDKIVIAIGLYIERKGIIDFVELARRMPEYKFIWFGESPIYASPKKVREAVKTKLPNLKLPGYVDPTIIRGAMSAANIYVFPTYEETEGMPVLEALTSKQNLLIRDIPVFDGWLKDGVNCHKAKAIDEFEDKIKKIIKGELADVTEEGYKVAHRKNIKNVGKNMKKIYEELLEEKRT